MSSGVSRVMTGAILGTGVAINVRTVGFRPRKVELINADSGDQMDWSSSMADAAGYKRVAAGTGAMVSSGGVTPLSSGFTLGTDADMNAAGETVHWIAYE